METMERAEELLASLEAEVAAEKRSEPEGVPAGGEGTTDSVEYDPFMDGEGGGERAVGNGEGVGGTDNSLAAASSEKKRRRRKSRFDTGPVAGDEAAVPAPGAPGPIEENGKDAAVEGGGGDEKATSKRRRRSRWDAGDKTTTSATPKVDLTMMASMVAGQISGAAGFETSTDPHVQALQADLNEINRRLMSGDLDTLMGGEDEDRSPSPEPEYDAMGKRTNTREIRVRAKLQDRRADVIAKLIQADPKYRPPLDYRPLRKNRKILIPVNDFPGYNFIGLIIGPRGNTQKRMEKETGCKIAIRGKGAVKEGRASKGGVGGQTVDPYAHEDLHVYIQGETEESVNAAAEMIEKLLEPQNEDLNDHKKEQLRELALMNGTLREETQTTSNSIIAAAAAAGTETDIIAVAKEEAFQLPGAIQKKVDEQYKRDVARMGGDAEEMDREYKSFLQELGGDDGTSGPLQALEAKNASDKLAEMKSKAKGPDEANVYISGLPPSINTDGLRALFSGFGEISECRVIADRVTGQSRGFGFVRFWEVQHAHNAIQSMNGYRMEDKFLTVRIAGMRGMMNMGPRRPMMPGMGMPPPGMGYPGMPPMPGMPPPPPWMMYPGMAPGSWMPPPGPGMYPGQGPTGHGPHAAATAGAGIGPTGAGHDIHSEMNATEIASPPPPGPPQEVSMGGPGQAAMPPQPMPPQPMPPQPMPPQPMPPQPMPHMSMHHSTLQHNPMSSPDQVPPPPSQPLIPPTQSLPGDNQNLITTPSAQPSVENEYEKFMAELR